MCEQSWRGDWIEAEKYQNRTRKRSWNDFWATFSYKFYFLFSAIRRFILIHQLICIVQQSNKTLSVCSSKLPAYFTFTKIISTNTSPTISQIIGIPWNFSIRVWWEAINQFEANSWVSGRFLHCFHLWSRKVTSNGEELEFPQSPKIASK